MGDLTLSRSQLLLLAGTANRPLAEEMAQHLGQPLCAVTLRRFADGELFVKIDENVRGRDVFIIQPTNPPAENYLELLLLMDAARRASAARITAVLPYYGYARQDKKLAPREPNDKWVAYEVDRFTIAIGQGLRSQLGPDTLVASSVNAGSAR